MYEAWDPVTLSYLVLQPLSITMNELASETAPLPHPRKNRLPIVHQKDQVLRLVPSPQLSFTMHVTLQGPLPQQRTDSGMPTTLSRSLALSCTHMPSCSVVGMLPSTPPQPLQPRPKPPRWWQVKLNAATPVTQVHTWHGMCLSTVPVYGALAGRLQ